jgi:uncharacterized protein (TIGR01777 family)
MERTGEETDPGQPDHSDEIDRGSGKRSKEAAVTDGLGICRGILRRSRCGGDHGSKQRRDDFLAEVVRQWESAAFGAEQFGVRVAVPRIGLVLEKSGGMIGKMLLPFRLFTGGPIGSGRQFLPWVHMDDVVKGLLFPIENTQFSGRYNLVSPHPVTMDEFSRTFGSVLHRPSWLPVPDIALSILYGEGAKVILSGQNALPVRLQSAGYQFSFSELNAALKNILA